MVDVKESPEVTEAVKVATALQAQYRGMQIADHNHYIAAGDTLKEIKERGRRLEELRRSMTRPLDEAKTRIMELFRAPVDALAAAEKSVKAAMLRYSQERERERLEEVERERKARQERIDKAAEEALAAAEAGDVDKAMGLVEAASVEAAPTVTAAPKVEGISTRKVWKWQEVDFKQVPREYLMLDKVLISQVVTAGKGEITIPGIRVYCEEVVVAGGGRR